MDTEDNSSGVLILRQDLESIEERYMEQDHSERSEEGGPRNLYLKNDCSLDQTNGEWVCLKDMVGKWRTTTLSLNRAGGHRA